MNKLALTNTVFLLGAGRSGTKFLRDIIASSESIAAIPYDISYVWCYKNDDYSHDELVPEMLTQSIEKYIKKNLPIMALKNSSKANATILLEKSVPNTLRPAYLSAVYPEAKFIHLIRDGRAVTESALRLWQTPPEKTYLLKKVKYFPWENYQYAFRYATSILKKIVIPNSSQPIWGPRYQGMVEDIKKLPLEVVCARQWRKCIEVSQSQLSQMKQENILEIRYEELMKDSQALAKICDFLNLNDKEVILKSYNDKVVRTNTEKWKKKLNKDQLELINKELGILNSSLGYK